jgi:hypothetical protein
MLSVHLRSLSSFARRNFSGWAPALTKVGNVKKDKETAPALENLGSFSLCGIAQLGCGVAPPRVFSA